MKNNRNMLVRLILLGIFINFFGRDILYYLNSEYYKTELEELIPKNSFYNESINELVIIFFSILILYIGIDYKYVAKRKYDDIFYEKNNNGKFIILCIILLFTVFYIYDLTHMVGAAERGVGQFNRSLLTSLMRIKILIYPSIVFYLTAFIKTKKDWFILAIISTIVILSSILQGARRDAVMLILIFIVYFISYYKVTYKKLIFGSLIMFLLIGVSMYFRLSDNYDVSQLSFLILFGILGGLGINGILWQVKYYVVNVTGFLYGKTFLTCLITLFLPSSFLYMFGDNEFVERSTYLFNDLYNVNENMGYDFMLVADFYWNFGYLGYVLFIIMTVFLLFYVKKNIYSKSVTKRSTVTIIIIYFISGLRSDFGFLIKNVFYAYLFINFLLLIINKHKIKGII